MGILKHTPKVERLPVERQDHCAVVVDVRGREFHAEAYQNVARACGQVLAGTKVELICDLIHHRQPTRVKSRPPIGLIVRRIKPLRSPQGRPL